MSTFCIVVLVIAVILLMLVINSKQQMATFKYEYLSGPWVAREGFLRESNIEGMIVYIKEDAVSITTTDNNDVVYQKVAKYKYSDSGWLDKLVGEQKLCMTLLDVEETQPDVIPDEWYVYIDYTDGVMRIEDRDGTIYFVGTKIHGLA